MEERKTQSNGRESNSQEGQRSGQEKSDRTRPDQQRRSSSRRRRPRSNQQKAGETRADQSRADQPRQDQPRSDQQRGDQQRGDQPRSDQQRGDQPRSDQQRRDQQAKPPSRRRRPPRGRRPSQRGGEGVSKPRSDLISVKDDEISVDRMMKRLSQRASELDLEFHGPPSKGIIDTTKPSSERTREGNREEALAVEFVKKAVGSNEVLQIMASDDWNLATDYSISSHRTSFVAAPLVLLKRIIRRFVRFYTDFLVTRQNRVNGYLVRLCSQLVREHVRSQIESAHEIERLKGMVERQEAKFSSTVAAINARFDNDEARLDLIRSELEVRAEVAREELETKEHLAKPEDVPRDGQPIVVPRRELALEDRTVRALSLDIDATIAREEMSDREATSESETTAAVEAEPAIETAPESESISAHKEVPGDSESVETDERSAEEDPEL